MKKKQPSGYAKAKASAFDRLSRYFAEKSGEANDGDLLSEMEGQPVITSALKHAKGGLQAVLTALRASDDQDAQDFLACYDSRTPRDIKYLSWEQIAVASGIGAMRLYEISCSSVLSYTQGAVKLIVSSGMPGVVATSMRLAVQPKNVADRMAMLKAGTVVPVPKGSNFALQINTLPALEVGEETHESRSWDQSDQLRKISDAVSGKRQLPAAHAAELPDAVEQLQRHTIQTLEELP